jgi:hypothetical protein
MATENNTNPDEQNYAQIKLAQLHMEAAHIINKAKRRLFEKSREGTPLGKAAEAFHQEVTAGLSELIPASMYADLEAEQPEVDADLENPCDVSIDGIAEHMAHYPEWDKRLLELRAEIGDRDPQDIKDRATRIIDDSETYCKATRDLVQRAFNGDDIDALADVVMKAEGGLLQWTSEGKPREEQLREMGLDASADEMAALRRRVAELEAELERKVQPWTLEHDYPQGSAGGRRRGDSAIPEIMDQMAIRVAVEEIADNTTGAVFTGAVLLLIEHVAGLAYAKQFNDLDMIVDDIRKGLLSGQYMKNHSVETLRVATDEAIHRWVEYKVTSEIRGLTEDFEQYTESRQRRRE